jgi:hypothetical protein
MLRFFPNAKRSLVSLLILITDLVTDGLLFFRLLFRSRTALSAEALFLRKQLAFYQERQVQPRRLNDSARFSLILWSCLCNWKEALVIVKPETLIGWHRKSFQLFWRATAHKELFLSCNATFVPFSSKGQAQWSSGRRTRTCCNRYVNKLLSRCAQIQFLTQLFQISRHFGSKLVTQLALLPKSLVDDFL